MRNQDLARVFDNIANLMTIKGEQGYRVLAYSRAAETLRQHPQEAKELWESGQLESIPGVGKAIASKIEELLRQGRMEFYDKLTAEVPLSLLEILAVGDVGPKRVALFWKELGITTLEELEQAAGEGKLSTMPGMGAKSEARIIESIATRRRLDTGRISIGVALPAAEALADRLRRVPGVVAVEPAGSLRRWRETVGDVDLLAAAADREALMDAFLSLPEVARVKSQGPTKSSVELTDGLRVQLWVHPSERFGSALQYATGSVAHSVKLRELAKKQGLSLSEHGFKRQDGTEILCASEEQVYANLGLPWIPPVLREDHGELEAALQDNLPPLVELSQLHADLQSHSTWSDGQVSILEMAQAARAGGMRCLAITDHTQSLGVASGLTIERLRQQRQEVLVARQVLGDDFLLLHGTEVEILSDGTLDFPDEILAELDIVVASLHLAQRQPREQVTARVLAAINNPHVDVIGHPSARLIGSRPPADLDMELLLQAAVASGVAMEINAHPDRLDLNDVYARRAAELGCLLAISTDAHSPAGFEVRKFGVAVAQRAWVAPDQIISTWEPQRLQEWLAGRS